ncbi:MAG TPA: polysaccharide deacetylase family protein [Desulfomonilaceae bacterium]|nr:polysaccharide deacetylase family protein [Desulfomonilaceae bacterium]
MTLDWSRTLLLWDPRDRGRFELDPADFSHKGIMTLETDYTRVGRDPLLAQEIKLRNPEAIIFTRNDDMEANPWVGSLLQQTRMGYTAISAIDPQFQEEQTRICMKDCLEGRGQVEIAPPEAGRTFPGKAKGSFSLIFDLEQFGGARFGLPRLLPMLEALSVRATFFVTGFIAEIYPGLLERIREGGHEIAAHGGMHEFLQGRSVREQVLRIDGHARVLSRFGDVRGANFIYRMDENSPESILRAGLQYLVLFRKHLFHRTRFMEASSRCRWLRTPAGDIVMIPVGSETYGLDRREIEGSLLSSWKSSQEEGVNHISLLMHPFKDGALSRMNDTSWVVYFLVETLGLKSIPLREVPPPEKVAEADLIAYRWDGNEPASCGGNRVRKRSHVWWNPPLYHSTRTENLADALNRQNCPAMLTAAPARPECGIHVYPDCGKGEVEVIHDDPLIFPDRTAASTCRRTRRTTSLLISPPNGFADFINFVRFHIPRTRFDVMVLVSRIGRKIRRLFRGKEE